jgi:Rieske Fe-S protein
MDPLEPQDEHSRREALVRLGLGGGALLVGGWLYLALRAAASAPGRALRTIRTGVKARAVAGLRAVGSVLLRRDLAGAILALDRRCTHLGCTVSPTADGRAIACPCHGSRFDLAGQPTRGPATAPLGRLRVTVDGAGEVVVHGAR